MGSRFSERRRAETWQYTLQQWRARCGPSGWKAGAPRHPGDCLCWVNYSDAICLSHDKPKVFTIWTRTEVSGSVGGGRKGVGVGREDARGGCEGGAERERARTKRCNVTTRFFPFIKTHSKVNFTLRRSTIVRSQVKYNSEPMLHVALFTLVPTHDLNKQWPWTLVWARLPVQLGNTSVQTVLRESVKWLSRTPLKSFRQGNSCQRPCLEIRHLNKL